MGVVYERDEGYLFVIHPPAQGTDGAAGNSGSIEGLLGIGPLGAGGRHWGTRIMVGIVNRTQMHRWLQDGVTRARRLLCSTQGRVE